MGTSNASAPLGIAVGLVIIGIIIAVIASSIVGGVIAALGVIPSAWAAWAGMQKETQGSLAAALGMVFVSLGAAAVMIVLGILDWLRG